MLHFTEFSATVAGAVWRRVTCYHCGKVYVFRMDVLAKGARVTPFGINAAKSKVNAAADARQNLQYLLRRRIECVPCPSCEAYQPDMCRFIVGRRSGGCIRLACFY